MFKKLINWLKNASIGFINFLVIVFVGLTFLVLYIIVCVLFLYSIISGAIDLITGIISLEITTSLWGLFLLFIGYLMFRFGRKHQDYPDTLWESLNKKFPI